MYSIFACDLASGINCEGEIELYLTIVESAINLAGEILLHISSISAHSVISPFCVPGYSRVTSSVMSSTAYLDPLLLGAMHTDMATIIVRLARSSESLLSYAHFPSLENSSSRSSCRRTDPRLRTGANEQLFPTIPHRS